MRVEEGFQQSPFPTVHPYTTDLILPSLLKRLLPESARPEIESDLVRLGDELVHTVRPLTPVTTAPHLVQYDQWGRRVDDLYTSEGWRKIKDFAVKEGYIAIPYERKYQEYSRVYSFAKTMLLTGDCHVIMCPMGMTDGAARVIEVLGTEDMKREVFSRLVSRDPAVAFTSGQWMTERPGGSDVSQTETVAAPDSAQSSDLGPVFTLDGFKWFSSATDAHVAVALARTGSLSGGSGALSLFIVPLRLPIAWPKASSPMPTPKDNGILMHRLKNKIGTHAVPTAELSLNATKAWLIGNVNGGIKAMATMLGITRVHSAIHSLGNLQRCLSIARYYATCRTVNGGRTLLQDIPMHIASLAKVSLLYRAMAHMTFGTVLLLGKSECGVATVEEERRLRILTPTIKAWNAEQATGAMEECMAALGGQGYIEENHIGRLIRDGMVEKIWEGTTNVLALDLTRATRDKECIAAFIAWARSILNRCPNTLTPSLQHSLSTIHHHLASLPSIFAPPVSPLLPRPALLLFAHLAAGIYLLEHALWTHERKETGWETDVDAFRRWIEESGLSGAVGEVERVKKVDRKREATNSALVYGHGAKL